MGFCVNCGAELPNNAAFCPACGTKVEIFVCTLCGKEVDFDADFCHHCGARLHDSAPEPVSAAEPKEEQSKPENTEFEPTPRAKEVPTSAALEAPGNSFSWSYYRLIGRGFFKRVNVNVEIDDLRLSCTDTWRYREPKSILLKDISEITLKPVASFWYWVVEVLTVIVLVSLPLLPMFGVPLAFSGGEMALIFILCGGLVAFWLWLSGFHNYHHRLLIRGMCENGQREIVLEALKADTLRELVPVIAIPVKKEKGNAFSKVILGVIVGIAASVGLVAWIVCQYSVAASTESNMTAADDLYILPNSDTQPLTDYDVTGLSDEELSLARNEIYARHGRKFENSDIQAYFEAQSWYEGIIEPEDFMDSMLSEIEKENIQFLSKIENPIVLTSGIYQHPEYDNVIITLDVHDGVVDYTIDNGENDVQGTEPLSSKITVSGQDSWFNTVSGYIEVVDEHRIRAMCTVVEYAEMANGSVEFDEAVFSDEIRTYPDPNITILSGTIVYDDYYGYLLEVEIFWENTTGRAVAPGNTISCVAVQNGAELEDISNDYYSCYVETIEPSGFTNIFYRFPLPSADNVLVTVTGSSGDILASTDFRLDF